MKKILSMGIASAVLALTSVAAFAETAETDFSANATGDFVAGETVTIEIKADKDITEAQALIKVTGLEFVEYKGAEVGQGAMNVVNKDGVFIANAGISADLTELLTFKSGEVIGTITYKVTGEVGSDVSFAFEADPDAPNAKPNTTAVTGKVVEGTSDPTNSDNSDSSDNSGVVDPNNPPTGIALAVVPAVIAGAAVVVAAKKRK